MNTRRRYKGFLVAAFAFSQISLALTSPLVRADPVVSNSHPPVLQTSIKGGEHRNTIAFGLSVADENPKSASIEILSSDDKPLSPRVFAESTDGGLNALLAWQTTDADDGDYKVHYEASDAFGNIDRQVYGIRVINKQPLVTLNDKADGRIIGGTVSRSDVTFQIKFDGTDKIVTPVIAEKPDENGTFIWSLQVPQDITDGTYTVEVEVTSAAQARSGFVSNSLTLATPLVVAEPVKNDTLIPVISIAEYAQEVGQFIAPSLPTVPETQLYGVKTTDITSNDSAERSILPATKSVGAVLSSSDMQSTARSGMLPIVATESGWLFFGVAWYWWGLSALVLTIAAGVILNLFKRITPKRRYIGAESV